MAARRSPVAARLALLAAGLLLRGGAGVRHDLDLDEEGALAPQALAGVAKVLFVDAGSTGSKVFAFCGANKKDGKLLTECRADNTADHTNKGIAALAYSVRDCANWQIGVDPAKNQALTTPTDYAEKLLELVSTVAGGVAGTCEAPTGRVPMLATAGMRLLSQAENTRVWGYLCGQRGSSLQIADAGDRCGTIPGTTEAYYEWLANAYKGTFASSHPATGTFTVGGASAQIAIPLLTEQDVTDFQTLVIDAIKRDLDCTNLKLATGETAPIFNTNQGSVAKLKCLGDYVAIRNAADIPDTAKANAGVRTMKGLGLVSFLGLKGRGTLVAGGLSEIQNWATGVGCADASKTFTQCSALLDTALAGDVLWKHVKAYFGGGAHSIDSFSYNTAAATPSKAMDDGVTVPANTDQAWTLQTVLARECGPPPTGKGEGYRFGRNTENSCMRAYYTSLYVTSFFKTTQKALLKFDPTRDWAEGASALAETDEGSAALQRLLSAPLSSSSGSYAEGAMLHFAGGGA